MADTRRSRRRRAAGGAAAPRTHARAARTRRRRTAEEAREEILRAAERRLIAGGPEALRVQAIAREIGVTDAAIHHHFGSRDGLAEALLRRAGRRLKAEVMEIAADWRPDALRLAALADRIARIYGDLGYARLSLWLNLHRTARGSGMFRGLAEALHAVRVHGTAAPRSSAPARRRRAPQPALTREDSLFVVALLNIVLWAEPLVADPTLRSVGLVGDRRTIARFRRWCVALLERHLRARPPTR